MKFNVDKENRYKTGVYKITNTVNNKFYIGSTSNNFYNRYHQHISDYKVGKREIKVLYRAIDKYGIDNFEFSIIEICDKDKVIEREQYYLNLGTDYNCAKIAGSLLGLIHDENSKTRTVIRGKHHCAIPVVQYDLEGNKIKEYESIKDAQIELNIKSASNITQCCRGKVFSAGGYRWSFKNKNLVKRDNRLGKHKIRVTKNELKLEFVSHKEVVDYFKSIGFTKVEQGAISNAIRLNNKLYNYKLEKI